MAEGLRALGRIRFVIICAALVAVALVVPAVAGAVPATTVQGHVMDSETGGPIEDAWLYFMAIQGEDIVDEFYATTDSEGYYYVELGGYSEYFVEIWASGYQGTFDYLELTPGTIQVRDYELDAIVPTVKGRVTYEGTGDPFSSAQVLAYAYDAEWGEWDIAEWGMEPNSQGYWGGDLPTGVYRFQFASWDPQWSSEWYNDAKTLDSAKNVTVQANKVVSGIDAVMSAAKPSIRGSVYDADMRAEVADVEVVLMRLIEEEWGSYWSWDQFAFTDEQGQFTFYDVEPGGTYTILCLANGVADYWADTFYGDVTSVYEAQTFVFDGTLLTGKDINLEWYEVDFHGWVSTGASTYLPGIFVELWRSTDNVNWEWWDVTLTGAGGYYEFANLPSGYYRLGHSGAEPQIDIDAGEPMGWWHPRYYNGSATLAGATSLQPDYIRCDLSLQQAPPAIAGTVTRSAGAQEGVEGLEVSLFSYIDEDDAWETTRWGLTDAEGEYEIYGVTPGEYKLGTFGGEPFDDAPLDPMYDAAFYNAKPTIDDADLIAVDADWGTTQGGFNMVVAPLKAVASGVVKDTKGAVVPGAFVDVLAQGYWSGGSSWDSVAFAETNENGAFSIYMPTWVELPGQFVLSFDGGPMYFREYYNNKRTPGEATRVTFTKSSTLALGNVILDPYVSKASRLAGQSRFSTAASIAKRMTNNYENVTDIILASGENRGAADPLAAAGLTWAYKGAPMVLTSSTAVPQETKDAIKQIVALNGAVRLHVVGGKLALPDARITEIKSYLGSNSGLLTTPLEDPKLRIAGANRYGTAVAIAKEMRSVRPDAPDMVLIANGAEEAKFVDALSLSTIAAYRGAPILTVSRTSVPQATADAIAEMGIEPDNIYVAGGPNTVSAGVLAQLGVVDDSWYEGGNRLAGGNRYTTAATIADWAISTGWLEGNVAGVAASVPDALTGGAAVGWKGGPLLLTTRDYLWPDTADYLYQLAPLLDPGDGSPANCYVFGGPNSISATTLSQIDYILSHYDSDF